VSAEGGQGGGGPGQPVCPRKDASDLGGGSGAESVDDARRPPSKGVGGLVRCSAPRADGSACGGAPLPGRDVCMFHEPALASRRAEGRRQGGTERSRPRTTLPIVEGSGEVRSVGEVCSLLSDTINHVRTGQIDPRIANTVGFLASVLIRAFEVGKLEERLAALEATVRPGRPSGESPFDHELPGTEEQADGPPEETE
jgi:hypothetical protein